MTSTMRLNSWSNCCCIQLAPVIPTVCLFTVGEFVSRILLWLGEIHLLTWFIHRPQPRTDPFLAILVHNPLIHPPKPPSKQLLIPIPTTPGGNCSLHYIRSIYSPKIFEVSGKQLRLLVCTERKVHPVTDATGGHPRGPWQVCPGYQILCIENSILS